MSFLSILLVASAFYFAHARPDFPANNDDKDAAESSIKITDSSDYQHKLFGFMQDLSKAFDQYVTPLMSKLDVTQQDELKSMGMNGFASYVNYLLLLIQEKENEKDKGDDQAHGDSLPRNEMILQFESYYPLDPNTPFIPDTQDEEEAHEAE